MAAMRSSCLIIISLLILVSLSAVALTYSFFMDVKDPDVIAMANFAITEHNHKSSANLKLEKIESCFKQMAMRNLEDDVYQLVLLASNEITGVTNKYSAVLGVELHRNYVLGSFDLGPSIYH